jgi:hypothetical protein
MPLDLITEILEGKDVRTAILERELWSGKVKTKWKPKAGIFSTGSAEEIASYLKSESNDLKQAMGRLNFYLNRAGKNLSPERKKIIEAAKKKLQDLYA